MIGDGPKARAFQRYELTADFAYVRSHHGESGRRGNYSAAELKKWAGRIAGLGVRG